MTLFHVRLTWVRHPDFSVAIKLYKNPAIGHLAGLPIKRDPLKLSASTNPWFIALCFPVHKNVSKKKPFQYAWATERVYKSILNALVRSYVPPFLELYRSNWDRHQTMRTYFPARYYRPGNTMVSLWVYVVLILALSVFLLCWSNCRYLIWSNKKPLSACLPKGAINLMLK